MYKRQLTARELAARFEVSERTIYRDIEALSMSGVPVYCAKGRHGGIRLMEGFVLERSLLSESQQEDILLALQSLSAAQYGDMTGVLSQLGALFRKENLDWLQVDFSPWGSGPQSQQAFELLKKAVAGRRVIEFDYCASNGQRTHRDCLLYTSRRLLIRRRPPLRRLRPPRPLRWSRTTTAPPARTTGTMTRAPTALTRRCAYRPRVKR